MTRPTDSYNRTGCLPRQTWLRGYSPYLLRNGGPRLPRTPRSLRSDRLPTEPHSPEPDSRPRPRCPCRLLLGLLGLPSHLSQTQPSLTSVSGPPSAPPAPHSSTSIRLSSPSHPRCCSTDTAHTSDDLGVHHVRGQTHTGNASCPIFRPRVPRGGRGFTGLPHYSPGDVIPTSWHLGTWVMEDPNSTSRRTTGTSGSVGNLPEQVRTPLVPISDPGTSTRLPSRSMVPATLDPLLRLLTPHPQ